MARGSAKRWFRGSLRSRLNHHERPGDTDVAVKGSLTC